MGGLEFSNQSKFSPLFSFLNFCLFFKNNPLSFKILIDFCQFLYDSVEKVLFKADFVLHDRNAKANISTQSEYTVYIICSHT